MFISFSGAVRASSSLNTPEPGALDHALVDVGAVDRDPLSGQRHVADRRERVGLGAVGAAGAPGTDLARLGELGQQLLLDQLPLLGVAPQL